MPPWTKPPRRETEPVADRHDCHAPGRSTRIRAAPRRSIRRRPAPADPMEVRLSRFEAIFGGRQPVCRSSILDAVVPTPTDSCGARAASLFESPSARSLAAPLLERLLDLDPASRAALTFPAQPCGSGSRTFSRPRRRIPPTSQGHLTRLRPITSEDPGEAAVGGWDSSEHLYLIDDRNVFPSPDPRRHRQSTSPGRPSRHRQVVANAPIRTRGRGRRVGPRKIDHR